MDCHDVRQLLAFANRPCEEFDPAERAALQQHLDACPACAELAQADRQTDAVLAAALREVTVPAELKQKVLQRLTAQRPRQAWKWALASAAAILLAVTGGWAWYEKSHPKVGIDDLRLIAWQAGLSASDVESRLADQGIHIKVPRGPFDYRYFEHVEIVEFKGQRVPKLSFARLDDRPANASVLVLTENQFRMSGLFDDLDIRDTVSIRIHHHDGVFVSVIFYRNNLDALSPRQT